MQNNPLNVLLKSATGARVQEGLSFMSSYIKKKLKHERKGEVDSQDFWKQILSILAATAISKKTFP